MTPLAVALALFLGTVATGRAARLITSDNYPPALALRIRWINATAVRGAGTWKAGWADLAECPFCVAPYAAAVNLAWALLAGVPASGLDGWSWASAWWVVNTWAAVSYAAAMIVVRDEPPAEA